MKNINARLCFTNDITEAETAAPGAPIMCFTGAEDMASVLEAFDFVDGKLVFVDSAIVEASKAGTTVIVDVNFMGDLLLRTLVWWTKANKLFAIPANEGTGLDKGRRIPVRDGFRIIMVSDKYPVINA